MKVSLVERVIEREEIIRAHEEGRAILHKVHLGFGLRVHEREDGYISIEVDPDPVAVRGPAEAEFMHYVVKSWGSRLLDYTLKNLKSVKGGG